MQQLSLTQKYLICAVNDKGKISSLEQNRMVCLVLAGLLELEMDGCVAIDDKRVRTSRPPVQEKSYLMPLYTYIKDEEPVKVDKVVQAFYMTLTGKPFTALCDGVLASLKQQGLTQKVSYGLFGNKTGLAPKEKVVKQVVAEVRAELLDAAVATGETAALVVLVDKSGCLKDYFTKDERKMMKDELSAIAASPDGKMVADAVQHLELIMTAITITSVMN